MEGGDYLQLTGEVEAHAGSKQGHILRKSYMLVTSLTTSVIRPSSPKPQLPRSEGSSQGHTLSPWMDAGKLAPPDKLSYSSAN